MSNKHIYQCTIAVSPKKKSVLLDYQPDIFEYDVFDGLDLHENLTNSDEIPKEAGLYKCEIEAVYYQSNHPLDPVEYDCDVIIKNIEKLIEIL